MTAQTGRLVVLALVAALLRAIWLGVGSRGDLPVTIASAQPSSGVAPSGPAPAMATPASAGALSPHPVFQAAAVDERDALVQRMKADWCGFGAAEHERQFDAALDRARAENVRARTEAIEEARQTPGAEVMKEAVAQVRGRWVKALMRRGDPRSLAVADFLGGLDEDAAAARARLQALARTTGDPMVTALALQRPCEGGGCRNVEASQWSRLEPANLQAWLILLEDVKGGARSSQASYVVERMAAEGHYSRTYEREFKALLLSLPQTETPGLMNEAEMQFIAGTAAAWQIAGYKPLAEACQAGAAGSLLRCETVLDRLWEGDSQLDRAMALGMVRRLVLPAHPELRARWEPRAREYEAFAAWNNPALQKLAQRGESPCSTQPEMRRWISGAAELGEWGQGRAEMRAAGADEAALSAQWRRDRGRGTLDPDPARR